MALMQRHLADRVECRYAPLQGGASGLNSAYCAGPSFYHIHRRRDHLQDQVRCVPALLVQVGRARACAHAVAVCVSATGAKAGRSASYVTWTLARPEASFPVGTPYFKLHFADGAVFAVD